MIELIRELFRRREYEYSLHALNQSILRRISTREIEEAVESGEIIEEYPADKYGPSCLIFGFTTDRRPLHIQCTYPERNPVKVITLYQPDPEQWIEFRRRRLNEM
ncbi:conserved hypothetical protein [Candidatus Sulfopaludibacter sp. SbA6]|nr:conserved hypothetical protein [Candidatus Sulfopaludibacter sp. SbA6]